MNKIVLADMDNVVYGYATNDPLAVGGSERYQWLLARALAASGWSVSVGVRGALRAGSRETIAGVEFVGASTRQILSSWYRFLNSEQPDWWFWAAAYHLWGAAVEIAKLCGVRTIFSTQFDTDVVPRNALSWRPRWWPLYAWGLFRTDKIFVQHSDQLSRLWPVLQSKASVLPGIVLQNGEHIFHASRDQYVAWVGMLRQPKRPDLLIEIARAMPEIQFVVCGGQSHHRTTAEYSASAVEEMGRLRNVDFLGQVAPEEALRIIKRAALLLSTSDGEGFPSVFLEAWSAGTPVVSLKIDPDRVIRGHGLGMLSGTVENAVIDIKSLLNSPDERERIAVRARRYIADNHSERAAVSIFERDLLGLQ